VSPWTTGFDFDALAVKLRSIEDSQSVLGIPHVIELDELVVLLVGALSNLSDFAKVSKEGSKFKHTDSRIQIEDDKSALILIPVGGIVLGDGVVQVDWSPSHKCALQSLHSLSSVSNVKV